MATFSFTFSHSDFTLPAKAQAARIKNEIVKTAPFLKSEYQTLIARKVNAWYGIAAKQPIMTTSIKGEPDWTANIRVINDNIKYKQLHDAHAVATVPAAKRQRSR